ncbi:LysR family transcriptional regulator [Brevibacterium marinum]|uniref:DNA-binding transcriptional LysR family regulator n=1 Tax=Brevibacterium marinum TaxID=418643 RepID=A0A846RVC4_9MICO|nr:LysR family transcriptional regulator [Brevibacterium marinum]NJC55415.1 DNA-binding transcriptional LysR family regulator [Brevibacterium marinum]
MPDLRSLNTLLALVEYGSIHLAARALFVSHSTASRQIKALEDHYGTTLFERSATGVVPTGPGLAVADFARRMTAESELLTDSFGTYSEAVETITIVTSTGLGQTVVADAINRVMTTTDQVQVSVIDRASLEALQVLKNREADLCVNFSVSDQNIDSIPGVRHIDQVQARNFAVLDRRHPLARRSSLHIRDLVDYPIATLSAGNTARMRIEQAVRAQGQVFSPTIEATCPVLTMRAVSGTTMIAMMAERTIPDNLAQSGCTAVEIDDPGLDARYIQILAADPQRESAGLDLMVQALRRKLATK